jgi:O-Antigen ligase
LRPTLPYPAVFSVFFAILFYLCSADQFFAVRLHGFNFRLGQFFIFLTLLAFLWTFLKEKAAAEQAEAARLAVAWLPFFLLYALSATLSASPGPTFVKLAWALFNLMGAAILCLNHRWSAALERGFSYGLFAIAVTIWVQFIGFYFMGPTPLIPLVMASQPLTFPGFHLFPLGFVQPTGDIFRGIAISRPNAFYYEPSYAGCALAFSFPLLLALNRTRSNFEKIGIPAAVVSAVVLTSSRGGCIGLIIALLGITGAAFSMKQKDILTGTWKSVLAAGFLLGLVALTDPGQKYFGYMAGPLNPQKSISRINDPNLSEGNRLANIKKSLILWKEHPWFGNGVVIATPSSTQKLAPIVSNIWLEIAVESGGLGLLAFAYGLFRTVQAPLKRHPAKADVIFVLSAVAVHLLVNMNLTGTFPRLDYWLLFFLAIRILERSPGR